MSAGLGPLAQAEELRTERPSGPVDCLGDLLDRSLDWPLSGREVIGADAIGSGGIYPGRPGSKQFLDTSSQLPGRLCPELLVWHTHTTDTSWRPFRAAGNARTAIRTACRHYKQTGAAVDS